MPVMNTRVIKQWTDKSILARVEKSRDHWKEKSRCQALEILRLKRIKRVLTKKNHELLDESIARGQSFEKLRLALEVDKVPPMKKLYWIVDDYTKRCGGQAWSEMYHRNRLSSSSTARYRTTNPRPVQAPQGRSDR